MLVDLTQKKNSFFFNYGVVSGNTTWNGGGLLLRGVNPVASLERDRRRARKGVGKNTRKVFCLRDVPAPYEKKKYGDENELP